MAHAAIVDIRERIEISLPTGGGSCSHCRLVRPKVGALDERWLAQPLLMLEIEALDKRWLMQPFLMLKIKALDKRWLTQPFSMLNIVDMCNQR